LKNFLNKAKGSFQYKKKVKKLQTKKMINEKALFKRVCILARSFGFQMKFKHSSNEPADVIFHTKL